VKNVFEVLKTCINNKSKLNTEFAKSAGRILDKRIIYKDKYVACTFAMRWRRYELFN
jgi:hypothetical protein